MEQNTAEHHINANMWQMGREVLIPCFFEVTSTLTVGWKQVGRGPGFFGENEVKTFVTREAIMAREGVAYSRDALRQQISDVKDILETSRPAVTKTKVGPEILEVIAQYLTLPEKGRRILVCREWLSSLATVECADAYSHVGECVTITSSFQIAKLRAAATKLTQHEKFLSAATAGLTGKKPVTASQSTHQDISMFGSLLAGDYNEEIILYSLVLLCPTLVAYALYRAFAALGMHM